jgi:hypothetical protein
MKGRVAGIPNLLKVAEEVFTGRILKVRWEYEILVIMPKYVLY